MFVPGGGEIPSCEGTTQGDPLGMAMYALAISPLITNLHNLCEDAKQVWFADDASAAAKRKHLSQRCHLLYSNIAPKFGYILDGPKSYLMHCQGGPCG